MGHEVSGEEMKALRRDLGLSQTAFGAFLGGYSLRTIQGMEKDGPSYAVQRLLSWHLAGSIDLRKVLEEFEG